VWLIATLDQRPTLTNELSTDTSHRPPTMSVGLIDSGLQGSHRMLNGHDQVPIAPELQPTERSAWQPHNLSGGSPTYRATPAAEPRSDLLSLHQDNVNPSSDSVRAPAPYPYRCSAPGTWESTSYTPPGRIDHSRPSSLHLLVCLSSTFFVFVNAFVNLPPGLTTAQDKAEQSSATVLDSPYRAAGLLVQPKRRKSSAPVLPLGLKVALVMMTVGGPLACNQRHAR
jgi:hypothetical protein